ncbi:MAG TPA: hypothetical protein VGI82_04105 [Chitinophagaceae bacterium]|jgi:hypothetical protein
MNNVQLTIIDELSNNLEIDLHEQKTMGELKTAVINYVNYMISHNPEKLMHILYRVDVSEKSLKVKLQNEETDAGSIIAEMIIERQLQKIESKQAFKADDDIPENEKW